MIDSVEIRLLRIPLRAPYKLAFGDVTHFDTILVRITLVDNPRIGWGEATLLTGYTSETVASSWRRTNFVAADLPGTSIVAAKQIVCDRLREMPFTATALMTAIEMAADHPLLRIKTPAAVPLLAGINATDEAGIEREIEAALAAGFGTLKIKVGFDLRADLDRMTFIQRCNNGRAKLRIDANQGYNKPDGCTFAAKVAPDSVELLEQPCAADDWEASAAVATVSAVPLMLDESIYSDADIKRAADIGAKYVKLKLMKAGSLERLHCGLQLIRNLGMEPVLGNGVASDISCWMEACIARRSITNAGEMNGFLRQAKPLAEAKLAVKNGAMLLAPGQSLTMNEAAVASVTLDRAQFFKGGAEPFRAAK